MQRTLETTVLYDTAECASPVARPRYTSSHTEFIFAQCVRAMCTAQLKCTRRRGRGPCHAGVITHTRVSLILVHRRTCVSDLRTRCRALAPSLRETSPTSTMTAKPTFQSWARRWDGSAHLCSNSVVRHPKETVWEKNAIPKHALRHTCPLSGLARIVLQLLPPHPLWS